MILSGLRCLRFLLFKIRGHFSVSAFQFSAFCPCDPDHFGPIQTNPDYEVATRLALRSPGSSCGKIRVYSCPLVVEITWLAQ
jgi:hypothetical protein